MDVFGMPLDIVPLPGHLTSMPTHDLRWKANHHGKIANRNRSPPRVVLPGGQSPTSFQVVATFNMLELKRLVQANKRLHAALRSSCPSWLKSRLSLLDALRVRSSC
jgi:hypothetical protein